MEINQTNKNSILFISVRADFGGGPQQLYRTVLAIQNEYNIYVACPDSKPYFELLADVVGEERIIRIPHRSFNLFSFLKLLKTIRLKNIDLIHSHGKGAGLYSRLLSKLTAVPCVHTFHGIHIGGLNSIKRFFYIWLERCLGAFS